MVRKKKTAKKDEKPTEKVEEPTEAPKEELETEVIEKVAETPTEPEVTFIDETPKLLNLLDDAPPVPLITNIHEAVKFVDKYRVWKEHVKAELG